MKTSGKHAGIVGLGPSPGNMSQNDPKTTSLMMSIPKNPQPPTKKFFSNAIKKSCLSVWALEELSSAIGRGAMALVREPKTAVF